MGLWDLLTAGKRIEEVKMAFVGKYVFDRLENWEQVLVDGTARERFSKVYRNLSFDSECERIRCICYAMAMWELGLHHGIKGYQWFHVEKPAMAAIIDEKIWQTTKGIMEKDHGIVMDIPSGRRSGTPPPGPTVGAPAPPILTFGEKLSPEFFRDFMKCLDRGTDNEGNPFTMDDARDTFEAYRARPGADPVSVAAFEKVIAALLQKREARAKLFLK